MKRTVQLYLQDIWECILAVEEYSRSLTEKEFFENRLVQDAIIRRFEIMGEATKNIDEELRDEYPDIPWKKIAGMRDIFIHEYFGIKLKRVWDTIKEDIPVLKQKIALIIERENI